MNMRSEDDKKGDARSSSLTLAGVEGDSADLSPAARSALAAEWLQEWWAPAWEQHVGYVAVVSMSDQKKGRIHHHWIPAGDDERLRSVLAKLFERNAREPVGVFFAPNVFDSKERKASHLNLLLGNFVDVDLKDFYATGSSDENPFVTALEAAGLNGTVRFADVLAATQHLEPSPISVIEQMFAKIEEWSLPKPVVVWSGRGFHLYWPTTPHEDCAQWQDVQNGLVQLLHGDENARDPARILRVPFSLHRKHAFSILVEPLEVTP